DQDTWVVIGEALGEGGAELFGLWADGGRIYLALRGGHERCIVSMPARPTGFPSIGRTHPPAIRLERAIHDLYGYAPVGAPDRRPWLDHGTWGVTAPLAAAYSASKRDPADYDFLPVRGEGLHQIAVGPVHAGIIEPGHFRFTANGEIIVRLEERFGYAHKGLDGLLTDTDLDTAARVVARVSGDSTVAYSFAFARAVETALGITVPERAQLLRGVMAELERIANHFGDIGAVCNDASFPLIHAHCGIFREQVLAACDSAFGHRLMMDRIVPGGVADDMAPGGARRLQALLDNLDRPFAEIVRLYDDTPSLQDRTCGTGRIPAELIPVWCPGGFIGRASGRSFDARSDLVYSPYQDTPFEVPILQDGDVNARVWLRIHEVRQSFLLLRRWLADLPEGELQNPLMLGDRSCEGVAVTEAFRGDVFVWVRLVEGRIARCHARDPSWFQWPLLEAAVEDNIVADFPLCNKSFNCSYSGHDL
ncbi:MAG TPA: nickel-dependent hydrogenase large subunit, partial [Xanthobacteraceae bacterium]